MFHTLPDLVGDGGVKNLGAFATDNGYPIEAIFVQVVATGSGIARMGDANVSATQGIPVGAPFGSQLLPYFGITNRYLLNSINFLIPAGVTLSIGFEL